MDSIVDNFDGLMDAFQIFFDNQNQVNPEQAYTCFKDIRPDNDSVNYEKFTRFVFLVVDTESVESDPWECILCCDAPDFGEADEEIKLKQIRMPLRDAIDYLVVLEQLVMTPSEVLEPYRWPLCMTPPATLMITEKDRTACEIATPAEARWNKRRGIAMAENANKGGERLYDAEVDRVLFRCPRPEAASVASLHRAVELSVRKNPTRRVIKFVDNRTDKAKREAEEASPGPPRSLRPA